MSTCPAPEVKSAPYTRAEAAQSVTWKATSAGVRRSFIGTTTSPTFQHANIVSMNCGQFFIQRTTRSPVSNPSSVSPSARAFTRSLSSRYDHSHSRKITATRPGYVLAASNSSRPTFPARLGSFSSARGCDSPLVTSQIRQPLVAGAQPGQLNEVLRVEEQLVHLPHFIDSDSLGPAHQVVQVLECVLRPVADMMKTDDLAGVPVDNAFLQAGELRLEECVQHRAL